MQYVNLVIYFVEFSVPLSQLIHYTTYAFSLTKYNSRQDLNNKLELPVLMPVQIIVFAVNIMNQQICFCESLLNTLQS
jgi:hypothetical protein